MSGKMTAALAAALTCAVPMPGFAFNGDSGVIVEGSRGVEIHRITVSVAGSDLRADRDVRFADARLNKASKQVCGWVQGTVLPETRDYRTCVDRALTEARADLAKLIEARRG